MGLNCDAPTVRRYVVDRFGVTHPVTLVEGAQSSSLSSTEWAEVTNTFVLPVGAEPGIAEFYMELTYPNCFPEKPEDPVKVITPKLSFEINAVDGAG